jgi:hypothetical protein
MSFIAKIIIATKLKIIKAQFTTPYKINCWQIAYLRKSKRTFLVNVLFTKLVS